MKRQHLASALAALAAPALLATAASAQAINIDVGDTFSFPAVSNSYGAASGQTGTWNQATSASAPIYVVNPLLDTSGAATGASTSVTVVSTNALNDFLFDNAATNGDDENLMDDLQDIGGVGSTATWTFSGITNGSYEVYTYSWAPDSTTFSSAITPDGNVSRQTIMGAGSWPGGHQENLTYARHCIDVSDGNFTVLIETVNGFASVNGFQIVPVASCGGGTPGVTGVCFGSTNDCPCGATDQAGTDGMGGCDNSFLTGGAILSISTTDNANPSVSADTATPHVEATSSRGPTTSAPHLIFQGESLNNPAPVFGDGLRCPGGTIRRCGVMNFDATGSLTYAAGTFGAAGNQSLAVAGAVPAGGATRYYQGWYRNNAPFCTVSAFNLTNGVEVVWVP